VFHVVLRTVGAILLLSAVSLGQAEKDLFESVPAEVRESLRERLELLVKAQSSGDWEQLYDLLLDSERQGLEKEKFVARKKKAGADTLRAFVPQTVSIDKVEFSNSGGKRASAILQGCGQFRTRTWEGVTTAEWRDGEWRFYTILPLVPMGGNPRRCRIGQR
jgi:hypothetical protein